MRAGHVRVRSDWGVGAHALSLLHGTSPMPISDSPGQRRIPWAWIWAWAHGHGRGNPDRGGSRRGFFLSSSPGVTALLAFAIRAHARPPSLFPPRLSSITNHTTPWPWARVACRDPSGTTETGCRGTKCRRRHHADFVFLVYLAASRTGETGPVWSACEDMQPGFAQSVACCLFMLARLRPSRDATRPGTAEATTLSQGSAQFGQATVADVCTCPSWADASLRRVGGGLGPGLQPSALCPTSTTTYDRASHPEPPRRVFLHFGFGACCAASLLVPAIRNRLSTRSGAPCHGESCLRLAPGGPRFAPPPPFAVLPPCQHQAKQSRPA